MRVLIVGFLLLAAAASPAVAEPDPSEALIVVMGRGTASRPAEFYDLGGQIDVRGPSQAEAIRLLSEAQVRLKAGVSQATTPGQATVEFSQLQLNEISDPECASRSRPGAPACAPLGYVATAYLSIRVSPAARAGDVLAIAASAGATRVHLGDEGIRDRPALREEAARNAFENARQQAELTAVAAGKRLGRLVRVQDPEARYVAPPLNAEMLPLVVRQDFEHITPLDVTPQPVTETVSVTVAFAIVP